MIYLLHFERAIGDHGNARGQAQHYVGYADDVGARLAEHEAGHGAAITRHLVGEGIGWKLVRLWMGGRSLERRIKRRHDGPKLCPICNPERWARLACYGISWRPGVKPETPVEIEFGPVPVVLPAPAKCPF